MCGQRVAAALYAGGKLHTLTFLDAYSGMICAPDAGATDVISSDKSSSSTPCHKTLPGTLPGSVPGGLVLPPTVTFTAYGIFSSSTSWNAFARRTSSIIQRVHWSGAPVASSKSVQCRPMMLLAPEAANTSESRIPGLPLTSFLTGLMFSVRFIGAPSTKYPQRDGSAL